MIYFVRCAATQHIKIGFAKDPWKRLCMLRTGSPTQLDLVAMTEGGRPEERELHERFAQDRVRGEWFAPSPGLVGLVAHLGPPERAAKITGIRPMHLEAVGVPKGYASEIIRGIRTPGLKLAVKIYEACGGRYGLLAHADAEEIAVIARVLKRAA